MPIQALFDTLRESDNPAADAALVTALAEAEPEAMEAIARTLLARGRLPGLTGLVAHYHRMPEDLRREIRESVNQLYAALREACSLDDPDARMNVISIIQEAMAFPLSYLLSVLLRDRSPRVRKAAAATMQALTDHFLNEMAALSSTWSGESVPAAEALAAGEEELRKHLQNRDHLMEAVSAGLELFEKHLHPPVIETAMWLMDYMPDRFWPVLRSAGGHARRAAIDIVQTNLTPRLVPFAIEALAYDEFRPTIVRLLSGRLSEETMLEWVRQAWRLDAEWLRKPMRLVKQWPQFVETFGHIEVWTEADQCRAVYLLEHTHLPAETKVSLLRKLLSHGQGSAKRAAVWGLCELNCAASTMLLRAVAETGIPELTQIAKREIRRRQAAEAKERTAEAAAGAEAAEADEIDRYWAEFEALDEREQVRRGSALLNQPGNVAGFLKTRLSSHSVPVRVKALRILAVTGCAHLFEQAVYGLAHDADPVVRSAAMSVLGQIATATSELLLRGALRDPDSRVQANALESLDQLQATAHEPAVHEKLRDANNRTRANAVKALLKLRVREAAEALYGMLRDTDPEQRRSGLWVVGQMRLVPLVSRIVELAKSDPDPQVRHRAQAILAGTNFRGAAEAAESSPQEVAP